MNSKTLKIIAAVVVVLLLTLWLRQVNEHRSAAPEYGLLLPDFKTKINEVNKLTVTPGGEKTTAFTISRKDKAWGVDARNGYPADVGNIRNVLLAFEEAKIVEHKTADPKRYSKLDIEGPGNKDSKSVALVVSGEGFSHTIILGKTAQKSYRYVRFDDDPAGLMIDKNPEVGTKPSDWLATDLIDIDAGKVRSVVLGSGSDEIQVAKADRALKDFSVTNIPAGRELSYATVANNIGGALAGLKLTDVMHVPTETGKDADQPDRVAVFETWDGLQVTVRVYGKTPAWISLSAAVFAPPTPVVDKSAAPVTKVDDKASASGATEASSATSKEEKATAPDPTEQAAKINERAQGWRFLIADYQLRQLTEGWDDILKAKPEAKTEAKPGTKPKAK